MAKKKKIANFSIFLDLREGCQKHEDKEKTSKDPSFEGKSLPKEICHLNGFNHCQKEHQHQLQILFNGVHGHRSSINQGKSSSTSKKISSNWNDSSTEYFTANSNASSQKSRNWSWKTEDIENSVDKMYQGSMNRFKDHKEE